MNYLNTTALLNDIQKSLTDESDDGRVRLLSYLNAAMYGILYEPREWQFLKVKTTVKITNNRIFLPFDFGRLEYITLGTSYFFDQSNLLTPLEAFSIADTNSALVGGITLDATANTLNFVPSAGAETTGVLHYISTMNDDYADSTEETIWPVQVSNLLQRMVLTQWYEFDSDDKVALSAQLEAAELRKVKAWDNSLVPVPKMTPQGYVR